MNFVDFLSLSLLVVSTVSSIFLAFDSFKTASKPFKTRLGIMGYRYKRRYSMSSTNHCAFKRVSAGRKYKGARKNEVSDHLGGVRSSTESKFASPPSKASIFLRAKIFLPCSLRNRFVYTRLYSMFIRKGEVLDYWYCTNVYKQISIL